MTLLSIETLSDHIILLKKSRRYIDALKTYLCTMRILVLVKECVRKLRVRIRMIMLNKIYCEL